MTSPARLAAFVLIVGATCGALLIGTSIATRNGWVMFLPYLLLGIVVTVFLRGRGIASYGQCFILSFASYVLATLIMEAYIVAAVNPQLAHRITASKFLGPIIIMLLIGAAGSLVVAVAARYQVSGNGPRRSAADV